MSAQRDPDLEQVGVEQGWDADLYDLADYLREGTHPYSHIEPAPQFRMALRRSLMREAWDRASKPPLPWYRRMLAPQPMAWAGAAAGAVLIFSVAFLYTLGPHQSDRVNVAVTTNVSHAQLDSMTEPIKLTFSQPMDQSSVRLDIQPATTVTSQWQGNTLTITPVNGLAGNTQYQVTVSSARTRQGQAARIQPVVFSTGPTPTPTPSAGPTQTPPPLPILNPRLIGPISPVRAVWSADGGSLIAIGPGGQLQLYPIAGGGQAQKLADGATLAAAAPDGSVAWFSSTQGVVTWKQTTVSGVQPIALGFRANTSLLMATTTDVETAADRNRVVSLRGTADAAHFSAGGDRLAYHSADGVHLIDLTTGKDTLLGPGSVLGGAWSQDDHHYAYPTDGGVSVADAVTGATASLTSLSGVTGVSWSRGNQILLTTGSSLYTINYTDGGGAPAKKLQDGTYGQPDWSPAGNGQFSFTRAGSVWVASVRGATTGGPVPTTAPGLTQDELVSSFMTARKNQLASQALQFLDPAGQAAFSQGLNLVYADPSASLARYYVLLSQPGRVVVRLVLAHPGGLQSAVDETLLIQPDANGHPLIHGVTETQRTRFAAGPEVVSVAVSGNQVQVVFDSDLDPNSAVQPGAVAIKGVTTQSTFDSKQRTVILTVPGGLTPGASYDLIVAPILQDLNQRTAVPYDLQLTGPVASTSSSTSPTPSPSPS